MITKSEIISVFLQLDEQSLKSDDRFFFLIPSIFPPKTYSVRTKDDSFYTFLFSPNSLSF